MMKQYLEQRDQRVEAKTYGKRTPKPPTKPKTILRKAAHNIK